MKDKVDYSEWLKKITYCLYIVIVFLVINSILLIVTIGNSEPKTTASDTDTEDLPYDVSEFTEMTSDEALVAMQSSELQVIYFGASTCHFCRQYVPVLTKVQAEYGIHAIYVDMAKVTTEESETWMALDEYVQTNFGYTPLTIIVKDGAYVAGQLGAMSEENLTSFLETNGFQKN